VNTQPGMTPLSLVPEQARYRGMPYEELVERIVEEALARRSPRGAGGAS
jgi:D-alanine-D-alanine ligase